MEPCTDAVSTNSMQLCGRFDAQSPGMVRVRETVGQPEIDHHLLKSGVQPSTLPSQPPAALKPPGLDAARQTYLYRYIREYVEEPWKDIMCPLPGSVFPLTDSEPQPSTLAAHQSDDAASDSELQSPVTSGRGRASCGRGRGCGRSRDQTTTETEGRGRGGRGRTSRGRGRGRGDQTITVASAPSEPVGRGRRRGRGKGRGRG